MMEIIDLTEDSDEEDSQRKTLPQRRGRPRPGELSIAALESRSVEQLGAPATKRRPAPKRQRCGPHIKDEGGGPAFLPPRDPDHQGEMGDGGSDQENHEEECQLQAKHGLLLHGLRPQGDGTFQASSVSFKIDTQDALPVTIGRGQGVLVRMTGDPLGVAKVLAVQEMSGTVMLALWYGWLARDFVDLSLLQHPPVQPRYPRQMYWQKDLCADGRRHVRGKNAGTYKEYVPWTSVAGLCTIKPRAQCTEEELRKPVPEEHHLSSAQPPEVFFHRSIQYDHTIKRWEHEWAGLQAGGSRDLTVPLLVEDRELTMMDVCCGLGTVSLAGRALTEAARSTAPDHSRGFTTLWAVDKDWENDPKTGSRRPAATQYPFDSFMDGYGCTQIREAVSLEELAEAMAEKQRTGADPAWGQLPVEGDVDVLHASPPCQELSMLNQHTDALKVERILYPLLDQLMAVIENVMPKFITVEEVDGFLFHGLDLDRKAADGVKERMIVRCIWRMLLPLLDMGYQMDVRIMNSVHYAVPQQRRRLIIFAAKEGYRLPTPPIPWTHWNMEGCRPKDYRDEALLNCPGGSWKSTHVLSEPHLATHRLAAPMSAREALQDLPAPLAPARDGRGGTRHPPSMSLYPNDNRKLQSPYGQMMREGRLKVRGTIMYHADMKPATEPFNVLNGHLRASYDAPFPCIYGSNSKHTKSQLHPDPTIDRVLTVAERKRLQSIPDDVPLKGAYASQLKLVGNAVPLLLGWAILGAVYEAAYGTPAPKPAFLADRPAWNALADTPAVEALGVTPAAGALEAAEPEAEAGRAKVVKMEEWDDQDIAEGGIEPEAANDIGIAGPFLRDEAADEGRESIQIFSQGIEGSGAAQRGNGINTEYVNLLSRPERSDLAANDVKSGAALRSLASPDSVSTQHKGAFGSLSPSWQHAKHSSTHKPAVKREDNTTEKEHRLAGQKSLPKGEQRRLEQLALPSGLLRRFAAAADLHCANGVDASRCEDQNLGRGALLQAGMAADSCIGAAAGQPGQAATRPERPMSTSPQRESLGHSWQLHPPSKDQSSELKDLGDTGWASEHDVITVASWQAPPAGAHNPHMADDDSVEVDETPCGSITWSSSAKSYDDAALSPSTPSPLVST